MREWVTRLDDTHYLIGSAIGPHPFPTIVRDFQRVIGREIKSQLAEEPLKPEHKHSLLTQVKNRLSSFSDPKMDQFPEKKELINQYLSYIDIELSHLKGESVEETKQRLHELLNCVSNETLKERIVKNLKELGDNL